MIGHIKYSGRLGNRMLQLAGAACLAKQLKIYLSDSWFNFEAPGVDHQDFCKHFHINKDFFNHGSQMHEPTIYMDNNFFMLHPDFELLNPGYYHISEVFFQNKTFTDKYRLWLSQVYQPKTKIQKLADQILVYCRIGDVRPPMTATPEFYEQALSNIQFKGGTILTEATQEPFIQQLASKYNLNIQYLSPGEALAHSMQYDKMILDEGSFSWWMGILSQASSVIKYVSPPNHSFCLNFAPDNWTQIQG